MPGQKGEATGVFVEQHGSQITVTDTHLAIFSNRARNTKGLEADAQG
ncbi:hypothetical protein H206_06341 [Candidatus Electrothrix aarhusensis]|uniref:Uncharacterized protein n=1 Tax=Candidatus Electrothrix aarhusensis TaxID=1859131 RepID=A0A3S3QTQ9_9BACT|nr:hypothetical protein H206_06341 [Candidatus Electrothrix aarhusensis]